MDCDICHRHLSPIEHEHSLRLGFKELACSACLEVEWGEVKRIPKWLRGVVEKCRMVAMMKSY